MKDKDKSNPKAFFKMPHSEIKRIRKEYEAAKDLKKEQESKLDPDKLVNFTGMAEDIFNAFEELTGKNVNREIMQAHLFYYFEEGYEADDMIPYLRKQISAEFHQENPELFTIARLFPIRDQEKINIVWDHLAHYQAVRKRVLQPLLNGLIIKFPCGHQKTKWAYQESASCDDCILAGDLNEISKFPYSPLVPEELKQWAEQFKRQNNETLKEYEARTWEAFKEVHAWQKTKMKHGNNS